MRAAARSLLPPRCTVRVLRQAARRCRPHPVRGSHGAQLRPQPCAFRAADPCGPRSLRAERVRQVPVFSSKARATSSKHASTAVATCSRMLAHVRQAWRCVWAMLPNDLVHAFGLDMAWGVCAGGGNSTARQRMAVIDEARAVACVHNAMPRVLTRARGRTQVYIDHLGRPTLGEQGQSASQGQPAWCAPPAAACMVRALTAAVQDERVQPANRGVADLQPAMGGGAAPRAADGQRQPPMNHRCPALTCCCSPPSRADWRVLNVGGPQAASCVAAATPHTLACATGRHQARSLAGAHRAHQWCGCAACRNSGLSLQAESSPNSSSPNSSASHCLRPSCAHPRRTRCSRSPRAVRCPSAVHRSSAVR